MQQDAAHLHKATKYHVIAVPFEVMPNNLCEFKKIWYSECLIYWNKVSQTVNKWFCARFILKACETGDTVLGAACVIPRVGFLFHESLSWKQNACEASDHLHVNVCNL